MKYLPYNSTDQLIRSLLSSESTQSKIQLEIDEIISVMEAIHPNIDWLYMNDIPDNALGELIKEVEIQIEAILKEIIAENSNSSIQPLLWRLMDSQLDYRLLAFSYYRDHVNTWTPKLF